MKKTISFITFGLIAILLFFPTTAAQQDVREKVEVKWWVIPLFAVDKDGKSVTDLKTSDIQLLLDNQSIDDFVLLRKSFSSAGQAKTTSGTPTPGPTPTPQAQPQKADEDEKMIFFLFDTALSSQDAVVQSRQIAHEIVAKASDENRFIVMTIAPYSGLNFVGGPSANKKLLDEFIEKKVIVKDNPKLAALNAILENDAMGRHSKYNGSDIQGFLVPHFNRTLKQRNLNFFKSFETLYQAVHTIKCNKFIYLFTEGVSKMSTIGDKGSTYQLYLKQVAENLGKSGAVVFIINPSGAGLSTQSMNSGEESLRYLAEESGGKYMEGAADSIAKRIENIHRAYYEIAFSDIPGDKENTRRITVKSNRKGVKIHTMRSLKASNEYTIMNDMEKEVLVLNLVSRNPLFLISFPFKEMKVDRIERKEGLTLFHATLPTAYVQKPCDLFKIWVDKDTREPQIERESLLPASIKTTVRMQNKEGKENHFVLINSKDNIALVGRFDYQGDGKVAGFISQPDGTLVLSAITIKDVDFHSATQTLTLSVDGYVMRSTPEGPVGELHIRVSIQNFQGLELFNQQKGLIPQKEKITATLPFKWLKKGRYKIVVEVVDELTGRSDTKTIRSS